MTYTRKQLETFLALEDFQEIYAQADALRAETVGDIVHIRALLEFSNHCKRLCCYCGLNATDKKLPRFRMDPRDMISTAQEACQAGYKTIVLQSGEDPWYTPDMIGEVVKQIKKTGMAVTLSCGEHPESVYQYWRDCGADRYLLKHETSDPKLYATLHPDSSLEARVACLRSLKRIGYETGGGFMIGLPGQTLSTIAGDLLLLQEIGCDMAGIGPFIPHPDTPLREATPGSTELTKRAVALARLLLPRANLPATTALGVLDDAQKENVFSCGANVFMRKVTPNNLKKLYQIYPAAFSDVDIRTGRLETEAEIRSLNRTPV